MDIGFLAPARGLMTGEQLTDAYGRSGKRLKSAPTNSNGRCWTRW
jgi:hypothetical protein